VPASGAGCLESDWTVNLKLAGKPANANEVTYESASAVEARRRAVAGTIGLASGLNPDDRVDERRTGVGRRASPEPGALDVAPVTPLTTDVLDTRAALVDEEVCGEASAGKLWGKSLLSDVSTGCGNGLGLRTVM
jgi:hypothetical protein